MHSTHNKPAKPLHFSQNGIAGLQFDPSALEVVIVDRSGRPVWKTVRRIGEKAIRWTGIDLTGQTVQTGDYICKITYPDQKISYLPFVFLRPS